MITRCRPLLGTFVEITVPEEWSAAVDPAFAVMAHIHARMSFHAADSDLGLMRAARPGEVIALDPETVAVLDEALRLHRESGGLFDVAVGRQLVAAGFLPGEGIDDPERFDGSTADIEILDERHVRLHRPALVALGGIAKGHAVDRAVAVLQGLGVPEGLVNAGGDLRLFGGRDWPVALRDADGIMRHTIMVRDCAVASSANLQDRRQLRGQAWTPHIGRAKQPVLSGERITVIAESCILADAMTKIAMVDCVLAEKILGNRGTMLPALTDLDEAC